MNVIEGEEQVMRFYSIRQASRMMGIGYNTLRGAVKHDQIQTAQIGADRRVSVSAMNDFARRLESGAITVKTA